MKALCTAVVFTALIGICAAQWCMGGELMKSGLSRDLQVKILELHNSLRDKVAGGVIAAQPMAQNMKEMIWDQELTNRAQNWANKCVFQHEPERINKKGQLFGQNVSQRDKTWTTDEGEWEFLSKMISQWFDEVYKPYDSSHFSQMVWANTHKIGCGYSEYKNGGRVNAIFICNYFPSGNIIGKEPYARGAKSCEEHGLSASRSFRNLCEADDDSGLDNLHSDNQNDNKSHQQQSFGQPGALERFLQYARDHPVQLQGSTTSSPRNVQSKQAVRQFVQPSNILQAPNSQVAPFYQYQANTIRGVPPTEQSQSWRYQDQYSPFTSSSRNVQSKQTGRQFAQPTNPLQDFTEADDDSGLDNLHSDDQNDNKSHQQPSFGQPGALERFMQYTRDHPVQLQGSTTSSPLNVQSKQTVRQFVQPTNILQAPNSQVTPFGQYQASYQAQYSPSYLQQPQNTASFMLPSQYVQTNPTGSVPSYQTRTTTFQNVPTNVQGTPSIPDYDRFFQFKLPNYQSTPSTYQSTPSTYQSTPSTYQSTTSTYQSNPTNVQSGQYQPTNLNGYSSAYQTTPINFEGFLQKSRNDQERSQLRRNENSILGGTTSDSSDQFRYGFNAPRGNYNLQWFSVANPVSYNPFVSAMMPQMGLTNSGLQTGYTNSGFNGMIEPGFMYGNTLVSTISNPTGISPVFGFESSTDRSAVQYRNPLVPPVMDPIWYYNSGFSKPVDSSRGYDSSQGLSSGKPMGVSFDTSISAAGSMGGADVLSKGQTYKQFSKPRYMRKH